MTIEAFLSFVPLVISSPNGTSVLTSVKRSLALTFLLCYYLPDFSTWMTHRHLRLNILTHYHFHKA